MAVETQTLREENVMQQAAITDADNNLILLAPAGTGKTDTMARRIAHIISSGAAREDEILTLTFTNRACREMRARAESCGGAGNTEIYTIHAFCAQMIRATPSKYTNLTGGLGVCDEQDALGVIAAECLSAFGRVPDESGLRILQSFITLHELEVLDGNAKSWREAHARLLTGKREAVERICLTKSRTFDPKYYDFLKTHGLRIVTRYMQRLRENDLLDFNGLLLQARAILNGEAHGLWGSRYAYINVDEAQDLSMAEYGILERLCARARVLFCGDFNQTIYAWRGSQPQKLREAITKRFSPREIRLEKNYRSVGDLLALSQNFLSRAMRQGESSGFDPFDGASDSVRYKSFETPEQEAAWINSCLDELPEASRPRTAIITRTNKACEQISRLLLNERRDGDSPFMLSGEFRLLKKPPVKAVLACLRLMCFAPDSESLRRALEMLGGDTAVCAEACASLAKSGARLEDFADERAYGEDGDFFAPLLAALENENVVVFDVESTGTDVYKDEIVQLAAIRLDANGAIKERFERFLRVSGSVGDSVKVHGFTDEFLEQSGNDAAKCLLDFLEFTEGRVIVGHNVRFDISITNANLRRLGIEDEFRPVYYDTLDLSRRYLPLLSNHKLITVSAALGCEHEPTHDALDDIIATGQVLCVLADKHLKPGKAERVKLYRKYAPYFSTVFLQIKQLREHTSGLDAPQTISRLIEEYTRACAVTPEIESQLSELERFAQDFCEPGEAWEQQAAKIIELASLSGSELDRVTEARGKIAVITAHQAKGCEFDYVFLPMLQDGVFPTYQAVRMESFDEEKRVFYVCITRAKKRLYLSYAASNSRGYTASGSRFLKFLTG